ETRAAIAGSDEIRAVGAVMVDARSSQGLASVVAGAGAGGFGGAGSANLGLFAGTTEARISDSSVVAEDVSVDSHAASRLFTSAGGAATSVDARAGAFAITVDRGVSRAYIARSDIMADGRVAVDAQTDT